MGGIVIELQREALDEKISIESLIRKAYLVAKKLKLKEFEEWLNQEQNGYKKEFQNIVKTLAERYHVEMPEEELLLEANKWELSHGGLSGRSAQQFIDYLLGK